MPEITGAVINKFYMEVARPHLDGMRLMSTSTLTERAQVRLTSVPGARLTFVQRTKVQAGYMRFLGIGREIPPEELQVIGVQPQEKYDDLVVGFRPPLMDSTNSFVIVPSEPRHFSELESRYIRPRIVDPPMPGRRGPPHDIPHDHPRVFSPVIAPAFDERTLSNQKPGIYLRDLDNPLKLVDISGAMPYTTEACLSVARSLLAPEFGIQ